MQLPLLDHHLCFPAPETALDEPNGLLACGGDLSCKRLLLAYRTGIFPWFSDGDPVLWWSPDPRAVFYPDQFHISRRFSRELKQSSWSITINAAFDSVVKQCATVKRKKQRGTWITQSMQTAYSALHLSGHAHSIEVWENNELIGGLYGVDIGHIFCGESMFSLRSNASKTVLAYLCSHLQKHHYRLLDCQVPNPHLLSLGAVELSRARYLHYLHAPAERKGQTKAWDQQTLPAGSWEFE